MMKPLLALGCALGMALGIALALAGAGWGGASVQAAALSAASPPPPASPAPLASSTRPRRVVSLDLCTDEMLAYYGARVPAVRAEVAALSPLSRDARRDWGGPGGGVDFTGWPAHDGSLEQVLALHPDLVLTGAYNALLLRQRLAQIGERGGERGAEPDGAREGGGMRVEVLPLPRRLDEIAPYERRLLALLGLPASLADAPEISAAPSVSGFARAPRLLLLGPNGIGTGVDTLEGDILARAGWRNYVQARGYVALDLERIVLDPPDAVLWAAPASPALANRLAEHPAMKRAVPARHWLATETWRWQCPGPWSRDLVRELARDLVRQMTRERERLAR